MDRFALFKNLVAMAAADHNFTESEIQLLSERAVQWDISDHQFSEAISAVTNGTLSASIPESDADRQLMLEEMLRMMAADGKLADAEKELFARVAGAVGVTQGELDALIDCLLGK